MVSIEDYLGQIHVSCENRTTNAGYFKSIDRLAEICNRNQFNQLVTGFYLNVSKIPGSVRLSYFVNPDLENSESHIIELLTKNNVSIEQIGMKLAPLEITLQYKWPIRTEKELRDFLVAYTKVGLEMMRNNLYHSRCLMATYRFQVRWASLDIRNHFKRSFEILSPTFNSWDNKDRDSFLSALEEWPRRQQVDWAHFMVNLILPGDYNTVFRDPNYSRYSNPLSIAEINHFIKIFEFQIGEDWSPNALS